MSDKDDKTDKNPVNDLTQEDQAQWNAFAHQFNKEEESDKEEDSFAALLDAHMVEEEGKIIDKKSPDYETAPPLIEVKKLKVSHQAPQLDKRTAEKLRKGKMKIEARLDLHGLNRVAAYEALSRFITSSYHQGLRHVVVITGKGKSKATSDDWMSQGNGVLKQNVPLWLQENKIRSYILKVETAQPKDGGSGALYVYLKRNRD